MRALRLRLDKPQNAQVIYPTRHFPEKLLQLLNITIGYICLIMFFILFVVVALVAWALHLMQEAIQHKEFSLMLAGFLVSAAAAAMMSVYFLTGHLVGYMSHAHQSYMYDELYDYASWDGQSGNWQPQWIETMPVRSN